MGNKASVTLGIQELLRGGRLRYTDRDCNDICKKLHMVGELCNGIHGGELSLNNQDTKECIRLAPLLFALLDDIRGETLTPTTQGAACAKVCLQTLLQLYVIPLFPKKTIEGCVAAVTKYLDANDSDAFSLSFSCIYFSFSSMNDESSKANICLLLDRHNGYPRLLDFLNQARMAASFDELLFICILILQFITWILRKNMALLSNLRYKLRQILLQQQETLFELSRHRNILLCTAVYRLFALILQQEDKNTCLVLQESARSYGMLLWTLQRHIHHITLKEDNALDTLESSYSIPRVLTEAYITSEAIHEVSAEDSYEATQQLLVYMCHGNNDNGNAILRALPESMAQAVLPTPTYMVRSIINTQQQALTAAANSSHPSELTDYASKMSCTYNWSGLFSLLSKTIENPVLSWNPAARNSLLRHINRLVDNLDGMRRVRHEAWDAMFLEMDYSSASMLCVYGIYVSRVLVYLEKGTTDYIGNPVAFAWAISDRLISETDVQHGVLMLEVLRLLLLRYNSLLRFSLPVRSLCQSILKRWKSNDSEYSVINPLWLAKCIHILQLRMQYASRFDTQEFISAGGLHSLCLLVSDIDLMSQVCRVSVDMHLAEIGSYGSVSGVDIISDCVALLLHIAPASSAALNLLSTPQYFEYLLKAIWLLSTHSEVIPTDDDVSPSLESIFGLIRSILHTHPELYVSILNTELLQLILASSINRNGCGDMSVVAAELFSDVIVSACPAPDSPTSHNRKGNNTTTGSFAQKVRRTSVRKAVPPLHTTMERTVHLLPNQILRMAYALSPASFCRSVFNATVTAPDVMWNNRLRLDCLQGVFSDLGEWHLRVFHTALHISIPPPEIVSEKSRYYSILMEPQISGIFLRHLLHATSASDWIASFDVRQFAVTLLRSLEMSLRDARISKRSVSLTSMTAANSSAEYIDTSLQATEALVGMAAEKRCSLLFLSICKLLELFPFPEDLWYNDALPTVCNALDTCYKRVESALVPQAVESSQLRVHIESCCNAVLLFLRSLDCNFVQDKSVISSQAAHFVQSLRDFRRDARGNGPASLLKESSALRTSLGLCSRAIDDKLVANDLRDVSATWLNVLTVLWLYFALQAVDLYFKEEKLSVTHEISQSKPHDTETESECRDDLLIPDQLASVRRHLQETSVCGDLVRCCRMNVILHAPHAALNALVTLRLLLYQSHNKSEFTKELCYMGLPFFLLDMIIALLSDGCMHIASLKNWATMPDYIQWDLETDIEEGVSVRYSAETTVNVMSGCAEVLRRCEEQMQQLHFDNETTHEFYSLTNDTVLHLITEGLQLLRMMTNHSFTKSIRDASLSALSSPLGPLLEQLLTPSLLFVMLSDAPLFLDILSAGKPTKRPLAIWNAAMLQTLKSFIMAEISKIRAAEQSDSPVLCDVDALIVPDGYKTLYPNISSEVIVDGVYVSLLTHPQHRDDIGARHLPNFVEMLQASVSSSRKVLEHIKLAKNRRQSISGTQSIQSQLTTKQQVLEYMIRQHPELGYADLYVVDET